MTQILTHTPLWVFGLFFGLVYLGYLQSKTRQVSRGRLIVLPLAMLAWSLYSVWSTFDAHLTALAAWACAWVAVVVIGLAWVPSRRVAYDASTAQFTVPGSWMPLALMMGIFFFRYAVAVVQAVTPGILDTTPAGRIAEISAGVRSSITRAPAPRCDGRRANGGRGSR